MNVSNRDHGHPGPSRGPWAAGSSRQGNPSFNDPRQPAPRPSSTRAERLLQEYQIQQNNHVAGAGGLRLAKDPLSHLADLSRRLGANSGMIKGPVRAQFQQSPPRIPPPNVRGGHGRGYVRPPPHPRPGPVIEENPVTFATKSATKLIFPWQDQDDLHKLKVRSNKRNREAGGLGEDEQPARRLARMSIATGRMAAGGAPRQKAKVQKAPAVKRPAKSYLAPGLSLKREGESASDPDSSEESEMDVDRDDNRPRQAANLQLGRKRVVGKKIAMPMAKKTLPQRSARKIQEQLILTDSESEQSDSSSSDTESVAESEQASTVEDSPPIKAEEEDGPRPFGPAELIDLETPPQISISLPQLVSHASPGPAESDDDHDLGSSARNIVPLSAHAPLPADLVSTIEKLTHSSARLHKTKRLPFLLRNLRRGFLQRCKTLGISVERETQDNVAFHVHYEHTGVNDVGYEITLHQWDCPLCSLHPSFPNQAILKKHLAWDHGEFLFKWRRSQANRLILRILIREIDERAATEGAENVPLPPLPQPTAKRRDTLFPYVALSPSSSPQRFPSTRPSSLPPASPTPKTSASPDPSSASETPIPSSSKAKGKQRMISLTPALSTTTDSRYTSSSARALSTTATSTSTNQVSTTTASTSRMPAAQFVGPDGTRFPTPPPQDNILGPSARHPYLPAKPDYPGGHEVHYSCRPGGPTLYDLLNTLPMEPFGVLDWAVLDREEEIFESDEVKDEYKVIHALWGRWILLNRTKFIANYRKGVKTFIDDYWKIIHRAAGWDALRYWLLLLLANRFLTANEVAQTLKYYESLTGMDFWYNS